MIYFIICYCNTINKIINKYDFLTHFFTVYLVVQVQTQNIIIKTEYVNKLFIFVVKNA